MWNSAASAYVLSSYTREPKVGAAAIDGGVEVVGANLIVGEVGLAGTRNRVAWLWCVAQRGADGGTATGAVAGDRPPARRCEALASARCSILPMIQHVQATAHARSQIGHTPVPSEHARSQKFQTHVVHTTVSPNVWGSACAGGLADAPQGRRHRCCAGEG